MTALFTLDQRHERILLVLEGEIDLAMTEALRRVLDLAIARLAACGDCHVEVDLRAVTLLDCSAIGVLVAARRSAHSIGRILFVSHPTATIRRVLEVTGDLATLTNADSSPARHGAVRPDAGGRLAAYACAQVHQDPREQS